MNQNILNQLGAPVRHLNSAPRCEHSLQFYQEDEELEGSIARFIADGLRNGEGGVIVATAAHRAGIKTQLEMLGLSQASLESSGDFLALDAAETLAKISVGDKVDPVRFEEVIGSLVESRAQGKRGLRIFGEMVALFVEAGNTHEAIHLEELWNGFLRGTSYKLFCAYPLKEFNRSETARDFAKICETHTHVLPSHKYEVLRTGDLMKQVALLEQKALSLESEIEQRKTTEQTLRRRESELRNFVETATLGLHWVGADGTILWANKADYEMLGYRADEYIGRHVAEFYVDKSVIAGILVKLGSGESLQDFEAQLLCKDGTIKEVLIDSTVLWENGKFLHTQCFTRDITARKQTEEKLRASEDKFRKLMEAMPAAAYTCDKEGKITYYNQQAVELWGRAPRLNEELEKFCACYKCWFQGEKVLPEHTPMAEAVREGKSFRDLAPDIERPDGTRCSVLVNINPLIDGNGKLNGAINVFVDVTERRKAEQRADFLASIVTHSDDAIFSTNPDGLITSWNAGAQRLYGYYPQEVLGQSILLLIPQDLHTAETKIMQQVREGVAIENLESVRVRKNRSTFEACITASPIRDESGKITGISKVVRDISDKVRAQEILERTVTERTESLREALDQMEEFSYSVAHDLRAPLRAMQAYSTVLIEEYSSNLDEAAQSYLKKIQRNSDRMDRLTRDVLSYSRLARTQVILEPLSLEAIIIDTINLYDTLQSPKANIRIPETLPSVIGHEAMLGQCVANLLNNAVKFVSPGKIPQVTIRPQSIGNKVRIWFEDNGIGIKPEHHPRLFQMFERLSTQDKFEGTGIGLAIVRKAVEKMRGKAGVESDGINGSKFWIELAAA